MQASKWGKQLQYVELFKASTFGIFQRFNHEEVGYLPGSLYLEWVVESACGRYRDTANSSPFNIEAFILP